MDLRPALLKDFTGQPVVVRQLSTIIQAAKKQGDAVGHLLFVGPAGLGKTTLACIVAKEVQTLFMPTSGVQMGNLTETRIVNRLTQLSHGGILFIDEIHQLNNKAQDVLLPLMERGDLMTRVGSGENSRPLTKHFESLTVIGATTRAGLLQDPFLDRFKLILRLEYYDDDAMYEIALESAKKLRLHCSETAVDVVAKRSRGVPRQANKILWFAKQWEAANCKEGHFLKIPEEKMIELCEDYLGIDKLGLEPIHRKLLKYLAEIGPCGATTLCGYLAEDKHTLEGIIEPALIRAALIQKTTRGRRITEKGLKHLEGV